MILYGIPMDKCTYNGGARNSVIYSDSTRNRINVDYNKMAMTSICTDVNI